MDRTIERFQPKGAIACWQFFPSNRNYPGWHLSMDQIGRDGLITLLKYMQASQWPSWKRIGLTTPQDLQVLWLDRVGPVKSMQTLRLVDGSQSENYIGHVESDQVDLQLGAHGLAELIGHLTMQSFDRAMLMDANTPSQQLWFW